MKSTFFRLSAPVLVLVAVIWLQNTARTDDPSLKPKASSPEKTPPAEATAASKSAESEPDDAAEPDEWDEPAEAKPAAPKAEGPWQRPSPDASKPRFPGAGFGKDAAKPTAGPSKEGASPAPPPGPFSRFEKPLAGPGGERPGAAPAKPGMLRFQFRFQPWKDVLDWFARQADLSLVMDAPPSGTFNYSDTREYTPAQAIDLLNSVLLTKGYTLVRRDRMLILVNLEDGIPPNLVSTVPLESLDTKGEFELVSVLFSLEKIKPEEAEAEIRKLLGPQGSVITLAKSRQMLVTETAGRLRAVRTVITRIEGPEGSASGSVEFCELKFARPEDVLPIVRQLLDIPEEKPAALDGSIRIAAEAGTNRLILSGRADKISRAKEVLKKLDAATPGSEAAGPGVTTPQLEVYAITGADPQAVMAVLQTILAGQLDVRLALDPKTNNLIAQARPAQQATIKATLAQMQREGQRVEVIRLTRVDPLTAQSAIERLFGPADPKSPAAAAPQVTADATTRQLFVRGTEAQITQIRSLLEKMGENFAAEGTASNEKVRTIPLSGRAARSALERIQEVWPTMRQNKIRVVTPSAGIPTQRVGDADSPSEIPQELIDRLREGKPATEPPEKGNLRLSPAPSMERPADKEPGKPAPKPVSPKPTSGEQRSPVLPGGARITLIAEETVKPPATTPASPPPAGPAGPPASSSKPSAEPAPIVVIPTPGGLMIMSEDTKALDEFERLLGALSDSTLSGGREITIFYLKHAKAAAAAETLDSVLGGGTVVPEPASAFPMMPFQQPGPPAAPAQDSGASRLGSRRVIATGTIKITPDSRLNALVVQANPTDLDTIEQLLKILDQKEPPEDVAVAPKPRMIPIEHTQAQEIADVVKQVYADRMIDSGRGGPQPMGPEQMWAMMRGQGQRGSRRAEDATKMSIGVDSRTNSLIVAAPDPLFQEVKQLVEQLDVTSAGQNETVRVVTLHRASPQAVQQAISSMTGNSVQFNRTTAAGAMGRANAGQSPFGQSPFGLSPFGQSPSGQGGPSSWRGRRGMWQSQQPQSGQPGLPSYTPSAQPQDHDHGPSAGSGGDGQSGGRGRSRRWSQSGGR